MFTFVQCDKCDQPTIVLKGVDATQAIWLGNNFVSWCIMGRTSAWWEELQAIMPSNAESKNGVYPRKMIKGSQ